MSYQRSGGGVTSILLVPFLALVVFAQQRSNTTDKTTHQDAAKLSFSEFFEASTQSLKPSAKLKSFNNKRVRLTGFMAQMENELESSFFLVPRPVFCDEEGGGNADIPPEAVLVIVPFRLKQRIPFIPGLLEVSGILEIGNREENERVSSIRLIMERLDENGDQFLRSKRTSDH